MRPWRSSLLLAGLVAAAGCGGSSVTPAGGDSKVTVGTSSATGLVGGVVLDALPGLPPLAGAQVTVIAGGAPHTAMTDMNGTFSVKDVPVGSLVIKLSAGDHFDVYLTGRLDASAGNFPVANAVLTVGPVAMVSSKGSLAVRLVDDSGAPVGQVRVTARSSVSFLDLSSGTAVQRGVAEAVGTSAADGMVTLAGLPDFVTVGPIISDAVTVNVPPARLAGPNPYQFLGLVVDINATRYSSNLGQTPTLVLAGPRTPLAVLSSNLDCLETTASNNVCTNPGPLGTFINASGPINVAFNQAINANTVRLQLLNELGAAASANAMAAGNGNLMVVSFSKPLEPGRYNLALRVAAGNADQTKEYNATAPFFVAQPQGTTVSVSPMSRLESPANPADFLVHFSEPIGLGYGSTAAVPCVVYYEADLDGSPQVFGPGEWNPGGAQGLRCDGSIGLGQKAGLFLRPAETQPGPNHLPLTGFSSVWRLTVNPAAAVCFSQNMACSASGKTVHLAFSRNTDPAFTVKRPNGTPVPDLTFALPLF